MISDARFVDDPRPDATVRILTVPLKDSKHSFIYYHNLMDSHPLHGPGYRALSTKNRILEPEENGVKEC